MERKYNILAIDDDPNIIDAFSVIFEDMKNCNFYGVVNFEKAKEIIDKTIINLAIIDIVLPDIDGYEICKHLNQHKNVRDAYFILMSADKQHLYDRIKAFKVGAQDFISKPFDLFEVELMIKRKINYLLKASNQPTEAENKSIISLGKFLIDNEQKKVIIDENEIELTTFEYKLLMFFISNPLKQIEYNDLLLNVWEDKTKISTESARQLVYKLRNKIEKDPQKPVYLVKAETLGYIFYPDGKIYKKNSNKNLFS